MSSTSPLVNKSKRRNAPLSCAECRRLKLRCSRVFPCASCVKKGCAAICPDGALTTGKGNRFVLANTEALHEKINVLASRVRQLEDALSEAHAARTNELHPLLTEELLQIKRPLERETHEEAPKETEPENAEVIDAVGSLSITESGHTKFFGTTANAWYLLQNEEGEEDDVESPEFPLPTDIPWLSHTFLFSPSVRETSAGVRGSIMSLLPDATRARQLAEIYYTHAAWMYAPIPETEFYGTILPRIYGQTFLPEQDAMDSHRLAVLYMVLALGTLLDLDEPSLSSEATRYYHLGRAALSLDSVLESQSIPAIQALVLMCHFMFLSFVEGPRWALMGLAVKLAQSLGLHRDSGKWNLSPEETYRRRSLFYELYTYDSWQSLTFGRPPSFSSAFIDCQFAEETRKTEQGDVEMSFHAWKQRFSSVCLSVVHEQVFGARMPSYRVILELDKKVRNFYVPPSLQVPGFGSAKMDTELTSHPIQLTMQRYVAFAIREMTLFYMHRGFFARAMEDNADDPMGSKYAQSVLAAYNSACSFVGLIKSLYSQQPDLTERMWFLFTHVFSCAIVLGSIATKSPNMALAPSALSHLDSALALFEQVSSNPRAARVLPVLLKLKNRAMTSMSECMQRKNQPPMIPRYPGEPSVKAEDEELAALGGKTRLVSRKSPSTPSSPQQGTNNSASPSQDIYTQHTFPAPSPPQVVTNISPVSPISPDLTTSDQQHHWQNQNYGQVQDTYDYGYQQQPMASHAHSHRGHWQQEVAQQPEVMYTGHNGHHMHPPAHIPPPMPAMDMSGMHYADYGQQQQHSPVASYGMQMHSPMEGQVHVVDPDISWRNLFAQYNQV